MASPQTIFFAAQNSAQGKREQFREDAYAYQKSRSNRAMSILARDDSPSSYQKPCLSTRTSQTAQTVGFMSDSEGSSKTITSVFSERIRQKKKKIKTANTNKNTADTGSKLPYVSSRYDHLEL